MSFVVVCRRSLFVVRRSLSAVRYLLLLFVSRWCCSWSMLSLFFVACCLLVLRFPFFDFVIFSV